MKPQLIAAIGFAGLVLVIISEIYAPALLFLTGCIILLLVIAGTLVPVQFREGICTLINTDEGNEASVCGHRIDPQYSYVLRYRCEISGMRFVGVTALYGLLAMAGALAFHPLLFSPLDAGSETTLWWELSLMAGFIPVAVAASWLSERVILIRSAVAIGNFDPMSGAYDFRDAREQVYGGVRRVRIGAPADNGCLVFYLPADPNRHVPSTGMRFHRLALQVSTAS